MRALAGCLFRGLIFTRNVIVFLHTQKVPYKFLIEVNFDRSKFCSFWFYFKSSSIFKPEGYFLFFGFDICAALVMIVLRGHKGPPLPPETCLW